MAESKIFKLKDGITEKDIASCVERFLSIEKSYMQRQFKLVRDIWYRQKSQIPGKNLPA